MSVTVKSAASGVVRAALEERVRGRRVGAIVEIGVGLVLTVVMPAVIATLGLMGSRGFGGPLGWMALFGLGLAMMPIAYVLEWMTQGGYLIRRLREIEASDGGWCQAIIRDRSWRWDARREAAQWELMLFVPRMVFEGFATLWGMRMVGAADVGEVANVLTELVSTEHGVQLEDLRGGGDELGLGRVISFLLFYEWVGVSEDGRKVWALSETREAMVGGRVGGLL